MNISIGIGIPAIPLMHRGSSPTVDTEILTRDASTILTRSGDTIIARTA